MRAYSASSEEALRARDLRVWEGIERTRLQREGSVPRGIGARLRSLCVRGRRMHDELCCRQ